MIFWKPSINETVSCIYKLYRVIWFTNIYWKRTVWGNDRNNPYVHIIHISIYIIDISFCMGKTCLSALAARKSELVHESETSCGQDTYSPPTAVSSVLTIPPWSIHLKQIGTSQTTRLTPLNRRLNETESWLLPYVKQGWTLMMLTNCQHELVRPMLT